MSSAKNGAAIPTEILVLINRYSASWQRLPSGVKYDELITHSHMNQAHYYVVTNYAEFGSISSFYIVQPYPVW